MSLSYWFVKCIIVSVFILAQIQITVDSLQPSVAKEVADLRSWNEIKWGNFLYPVMDVLAMHSNWNMFDNPPKVCG